MGGGGGMKLEDGYNANGPKHFVYFSYSYWHGMEFSAFGQVGVGLNFISMVSTLYQSGGSH